MKLFFSLFLSLMSLNLIGQNIGIGKPDPLSLLDIKSGGNGSELLRFSMDRSWVFKEMGSGTGSKLTLQNLVDGKRFEIIGIDDMTKVAVFNSWVPGPEVYFVPTIGKVGIGTEIPLQTLHVRGDIHMGGGPEKNDGDAEVIVLDGQSGNWKLGVQNEGTDGETDFYIGKGYIEDGIFHIRRDGNVGIGTLNPQEKLHVNGGLRLESLSGTGIRNLSVDPQGDIVIGANASDFWTSDGPAIRSDDEVYVDAPSATASSLRIRGKHSNGNNFASLAIWNDSPNIPPGDYKRMLIDANDIDAFKGSGSTPIAENIRIQRQSSGNLIMVEGGGNVGVGISPSSKLTVQGPDNNGSSATLEVKTSGGQTMLIDGNELDVTGTSNTLYINANSNKPVTIGAFTEASGYMLSVSGKIAAEEIRIQTKSAWPDYVFDDNYDLLPLDELEKKIIENKHLPGIPSAEEVAKEGLVVGDMQRKMMEKIEELTLYIIDQQKTITNLEERIKSLEDEKK